MDGIIIGFIGAVIALLLKSIYDRLTNAIRVNRIRYSIIVTLLICKTKLQQYISDCEQVKKVIMQVSLSEKDKKYGFDDMPMLNSAIFKSFAQSDLLVATHSTTSYLALINLYYCIDFLKENLPRVMYENYADWTVQHLKEKNIAAGNEQIEHLKTCYAVRKEREKLTENINMKISTARENLSAAEFLISKLKKYSSRRWIWKYLIRF